MIKPSLFLSLSVALVVIGCASASSDPSEVVQSDPNTKTAAAASSINTMTKETPSLSDEKQITQYFNADHPKVMWTATESPIFDVSGTRIGDLRAGAYVRVYEAVGDQAYIMADKSKWVSLLSLTAERPQLKRGMDTISTGQERINRESLLEQIRRGERDKPAPGK